MSQIYVVWPEKWTYLVHPDFTMKQEEIMVAKKSKVRGKKGGTIRSPVRPGKGK